MQQRVQEAQSELRESENALQAFLEANRQFNTSPPLQFQRDRLERQVALRQQVLMSLSTQFEDAKVQAVNDTPVITTVDEAVAPFEKSRPRRRRNVILAFFASSVFALAIAFGKEYLRNARRGSLDYDHFATQWENTKREMRDALLWRRRRRQP
jgi:uncharacterized protein involved in exopolysaccharide biosynthesis